MVFYKLTTILLFNRLLCTFNDLVELGAYIVQGISNTHTHRLTCKKKTMINTDVKELSIGENLRRRETKIGVRARTLSFHQSGPGRFKFQAQHHVRVEFIFGSNIIGLLLMLFSLQYMHFLADSS